MAIYGLNFNNVPIPEAIQKKFAREKKFDLPRGQYARLQGVAQSPIERDSMLIQANNGTRRIWIAERQTAGGTWYGIYCY